MRSLINTIPKVGKTFIKDKKSKKDRKFSYKDIDYDPDKWADAKKFFPADFDLMLLKTKDKTYSGWASGYKWDGYKHKKENEVLYWKRLD